MIVELRSVLMLQRIPLDDVERSCYYLFTAVELYQRYPCEEPARSEASEVAYEFEMNSYFLVSDDHFLISIINTD